MSLILNENHLEMLIRLSNVTESFTKASASKQKTMFELEKVKMAKIEPLRSEVFNTTSNMCDITENGKKALQLCIDQLNISGEMMG